MGKFFGIAALVAVLTAEPASAQSYTWTELQPGGNVDASYESCAFSSPYVLLGVFGGNSWVSSNLGSSWTVPTSNNRFRGAAMTPSGGSMALGEYEAQRSNLSTDFGATWGSLGVAAGYTQAIGVSSDGTHFIVGQASDLMLSANSASSWTTATPGGHSGAPWGIAAMSSDASLLLAGMDGGRLYTSGDFGSTWVERQPAGNTDNRWYVGNMSSNGSHMIVGANGGRVYTSADYGVSWTETRPMGDVNVGWFLVNISGDSSVLVAGAGYTRLYTSTNFGSTWTEQQPHGDASRPWGNSCFSPNNNLIVLDARVWLGSLPAVPTATPTPATTATITPSPVNTATPTNTPTPACNPTCGVNQHCAYPTP